jgi:hypothetical protein
MLAGINTSTKALNTDVTYGALVTSSGIVWGSTTDTNPSNTTAVLVGIFVSSSTSGTIELINGSSSNGEVLVSSFDVTGATWYDLGNIRFPKGLYATIGGTVSCTFAYYPAEPLQSEYDAYYKSL